jgi:hypothetical protein
MLLQLLLVLQLMLMLRLVLGATSCLLLAAMLWCAVLRGLCWKPLTVT